jgi:hypothetical protein
MASVPAAPMVSLSRAIEFVTGGPSGLLPRIASPAFTDSFLFGSMSFSGTCLLPLFLCLRRLMDAECTSSVQSDNATPCLSVPFTAVADREECEF